MSLIMFKVLTVILAFGTLHAQWDNDFCCEQQPCCESDQLLGDVRFEIGYAFGKFIGIEQDYLELGLFAPYKFDCDGAVFADVRGYRLNNSHWASSVGLGLRKEFDCHVWGANVYYDYREGEYRKNFNRVGVGLEALGSCFDVRVNGYIPVGTQTSFSKVHVQDNYIGDYFATCQKREFCVGAGFDAELGAPLLCCCGFRVYGAAGPYYFRKDHEQSYWGGQARLELDWKQYLTLEVRTSYDHQNHSHTQGRVLVSVPFDILSSWCCDCCDCFDILTQPVRRNGIIFVDHCCNYTWNW